MEGQETELDCTVVEAIGDPIMHLLRNALEHGIETPLERYQAGKPTRGGLIRLSARHEGNHVYIEVEDDGRGICSAKILEQAAKGLISDREARRDASADIFPAICLQQGSPAAEMRLRSRSDAVKAQIEAIGGEIASGFVGRTGNTLYHQAASRPDHGSGIDGSGGRGDLCCSGEQRG